MNEREARIEARTRAAQERKDLYEKCLGLFDQGDLTSYEVAQALGCTLAMAQAAIRYLRSKNHLKILRTKSFDAPALYSKQEKTEAPGFIHWISEIDSTSRYAPTPVPQQTELHRAFFGKPPGALHES